MVYMRQQDSIAPSPCNSVCLDDMYAYQLLHNNDCLKKQRMMVVVSDTHWISWCLSVVLLSSHVCSFQTSPRFLGKILFTIIFVMKRCESLVWKYIFLVIIKRVIDRVKSILLNYLSRIKIRYWLIGDKS